MIRPIVYYGHPVLRAVAEPVTEFNDPKLDALILDMWDSMEAGRGVGLGAPQIGVSRRVCVIDDCSGKKNPANRLVLVNPEIFMRVAPVKLEEGCLSLPGLRGRTKRFDEIRVCYQNQRGEPMEYIAFGRTAQCIQHEVDHLDGILFIDRMSTEQRELLLAKLAKGGGFKQVFTEAPVY